MLFRFGAFWQTIGIVVAAWIFYGIWDFEFTTVTLLAWILALKLQDR